MAITRSNAAMVLTGGVGVLCATLGAAQSPPAQQSLPVQSSPAPVSRSVLDGVYTEDQAKRGQSIYARECASCHGDALEGGDEGPPLSGSAFASSWNGSTAGAIFDRIRSTMPADAPGGLSLEEDADVLAYMLSVAKFPAGETELAAKAEILKQIRFETARPQR